MIDRPTINGEAVAWMAYELAGDEWAIVALTGFVLTLALSALLWWLKQRRSSLPLAHSAHFARRIEPARAGCRARRKPAWVLRQLVLLQAHLPNAGCRLIALTFNRVFAHREVTVSKSNVHRGLRQNAHAVAEARKERRAFARKLRTTAW